MLKINVYKVNDKYLMKLDGYGTIPKIKINGIIHEDFKEGYTNKKPLQVYNIVSMREISHYINSDSTNHKVMTKEARDKEYEELLKKCKSNDDDDDYLWETLEDEYNYRKFIKMWTPVFKESIVNEKVKLVYHDISGNHSNKYITAYRFLGSIKTKDEETLYQYNPNPYELAQSIAGELGFKEVDDRAYGKETKGMKWSVPDHSKSKLQFLKVNGEYTDYKSLGDFHGVVVGTFKECEDVYKSQEQKIRNLFTKELKKLKAKGQAFDKHKVIKELENIRYEAGTHKKHFTLRNLINNLIEELTNED